MSGPATTVGARARRSLRVTDEHIELFARGVAIGRERTRLLGRSFLPSTKTPPDAGTALAHERAGAPSG